MRITRCRALGALLTFVPFLALAQPDHIGRVEQVPAQRGPHWFWVSDMMLHRTALFDADSGNLLGTISSGTAGVGFVVLPLFSPDRREIYLAETYYSRGVRGERTDVVTVYDGRTLQPTAEIGIPPHRGEYFPGNAANALSDDGRFMAVFNVTPATSLSIVDVVARKFVAEVPAPGCSLVYAGGPRRFFMLCANGGALTVTLDDAGQTTVERTQPFFDPRGDPLTEKAVRRGNEWLFVSFGGTVHPVNVAGPQLTVGQTWSLMGAGDAGWRIGGMQHLAVHATTGRLYVLVHQGGVDTHKDPGTEVWVYDLATRARVQRIAMENPLVAFIGQQGGLAQDGWTRTLLRQILPHPGVSGILVSQDDKPVLIAAAQMPPNVTVHDAITGAVTGEVAEIGIALSLLVAP